MDQPRPAEDDPRRLAVRDWIGRHRRPTGRELAEAGYVAPHLPEPHGLGADPSHQLIIDDELARAGIVRPSNQIGIGWAVPTLIHAGTQTQKDRYVLPALAGEEIWCQLFSEPGAGSDLASLSTRAVRDGDEWVVNGQKVWTTGAHYSKFGILIARTDSDVPKHRGITYFICPMDSPGIEIRTIRNIAGADSFNEVFFTDVRIPNDNVVGEVGDGWRLAKVTLGNERVSLSTGGVLWGNGPTALDVLAEARAMGVSDPVLRQRLVSIHIEHVVLEIIRMRTLSARLRGRQPGPESSIGKIMADEHGQKVMELARAIIGADAMLIGDDDSVAGKHIRSKSWYSGYMFSRALTIGGGTGEVQRNILGERVLGLPVEPDPTRGLSFRQATMNGGS